MSERCVCKACGHDEEAHRLPCTFGIATLDYCKCEGFKMHPEEYETFPPETPDAAGDAMGDGWIPVDERQPDNDRLIWVMEQFGDGGEFTNFESTWGFYRKGRWLSYSHGELDESDYVRFWQEAPAPSARGTIQSQ